MNHSFYFMTDGKVASRVLSKLLLLDPDTLLKLHQEGYIKTIKPEKLRPATISLQALDAFAAATNTPGSWFLYGDKITIPTYTKWDAEVIDSLNSMSDSQIHKIWEYVKNVYPNRFYEETKDAPMNITSRFIQYARTLPSGSIANAIVRQPGYRKFDPEAEQEIKRFIKVNYSYMFVFSTDMLFDIATLFGVSHRWLCGYDFLVFCNTSCKEDLFDYYTLMQPQEQESFVELLRVVQKGG